MTKNVTCKLLQVPYTLNMINDTDTFNTRRLASEKTEDGDLLITWEVRAKGFDGIRAYNAERSNQMTSIGTSMHPLTEWTACGDGWLKATYNVLIDGMEIAIEARNDEWASRQQDIEDYCIRSGGW